MESPEPPSPKRKRVDSESEMVSVSGENVQKSNFVLSVIEKQYLNKETADMYFECGSSNEHVPAHRSILSGASPVFYAKFYGPNSEKAKKERKKLEENNAEKTSAEEENGNVTKNSGENVEDKRGEENVIKLRESADTVRDVLQFIYKDKVNLKIENITEVMDLLNQFQMFTCLEQCGKCWAENLTIEDVCWALHWAIHYDVKGLITFCKRRISVCPEMVFRTSGFLDCQYKVLKFITSWDSLACFETSVLEACLDWAKSACERDKLDASQTKNLRIYLQDLLYNIRFGSIDSKDFIKFINKYSEMFTDPNDYEDIFRLICGETELKTNRFNTKPRLTTIYSFGLRKCMKCNLRDSSQPSRLLSTSGSSLVFRCNQPLLLWGFICTRMKNSYGNVSVDVDVKITKNYKHFSEIVFSGSEIVNSTSDKFVDIRERPIIMNPEYSYQIDLKMNRNVSINTFQLHSEIKFDENTTLYINPDEEYDVFSIIEKLHFNMWERDGFGRTNFYLRNFEENQDTEKAPFN